MIETTTVDNPAMSLSGGAPVRLAVFLQHKPNWYDKLLEYTNRKALSREFPYYEYSKQSLTPVQCDHLANLAAWSIFQRNEIVMETFDSGA